MELQDIHNKLKQVPTWKNIAIKDERDLQFLTLPDEKRYNSNSESSSKFLDENQEVVDRVKAKINNPLGYQDFLRNYTSPHQGVSLSSKAWGQNSKVFEANDKDSTIDVRGNEAALSFDFNSFAEGAFWDLYKYSPSSIVAIVPNENNEVKPICLSVSDIEYLKEDKTTHYILEVAFYQKDLLYFFHADGLEVLRRVSGGDFILELSVVKWWGDRIPVSRVSTRRKRPNSDIATNYISDYVGKLEDIFYLHGLRKITDPHAFVSLTEITSNSMQCTHETPKYKCEGGILKDKDKGTTLYENATGAIALCPACRPNVSVGQHFHIQYQAIESISSQENVVKFVSPDPKSLQYGEEYLERKDNAWYALATGINKDLGDESIISAKTAGEILQEMEEQRKVLAEISKDIEQPLRDLFHFCAEIEYGADVETAYRLGTDYMLLSKQDALTLYTTSNEANLTEALGVDSMLLEAFYKTDETSKQRGSIAMELAKILGSDHQRIIALYELEKETILSRITQGTEHSKIIKDILEFSKTQTLQNEQSEDQERIQGDNLSGSRPNSQRRT